MIARLAYIRQAVTTGWWEKSSPKVASAYSASLNRGEDAIVKNAGFTLLELMIVLTIFGVLVAVMTPTLFDMLRAERTRSAVSQFVGAHSLARATAIRYGRVAELHIDVANARFWVEVDTSLAGGVMDTVRTVRNVGEGGVVMTSNRSLLCFDGRGLATMVGACEAGSALVVFLVAGLADTVTASVLGKIVR